MLFQSPLFIVSFLALLALLRVAPGRRARHALLLVASYGFYAAWDLRFLGLIVLSTLVDFLVGSRLPAAKQESRRWWLLASVLTNLGILGFFKYFGFFAESAVALAATMGSELSHTTLEIVLPVGISFYTFQSLSYTIDIYRGETDPEPSPLRFALFVAFFPQLVAGPIVRSRHFLPQLDRDRAPRLRDFPPGVLLFSVGMFKKVVIADQLATLVDPVFANPELYGGGLLALGVVAYAAQIYCDFSGYSDMAIGLGRILGYRLPRNFDRPYAARSIREFWQRWHISLSTWLRDYLYIPLGGSRGSALRTQLNLMLTMLLGGLWHGANWTFVVWGGLHGVALCLDRRLRPSRGAKAGWGSWATTLLVVLVAWICFRAASLGEALAYATRTLSLGSGLESFEPGALVTCGLLLALATFGQTGLAVRVEARTRRLKGLTKVFLAGLILGLAYSLARGEGRAFIPSSSRALLQALVLAGGFFVALALTWALDRSGVWAVLGIDPAVEAKWQPSPEGRLPTFYTRPDVLSGRYFFRRAGPARSEVTRALALGAEAAGRTDHPYGDQPPVTIRYGRYGFRSEYPAIPGGLAVVGASHVEAGFANAEETIVGWLRRDHDLPASNFGLSGADGITVCHLLDRFVLPTRPADVTWVFSESWGFASLYEQSERMLGHGAWEPRLGGFADHVAGTASGLLQSAGTRANDCLQRWRDPFAPPPLLPIPGRRQPQVRMRTEDGDEIAIDLNYPPNPKQFELVKELFRRTLTAMKQICHQAGATLRVVFLPSRLTLFWGQAPPLKSYARDCYAFVSDACAALDVPVVDTTPALRAELERGKLVMNPISDLHFDGHGMRVVARTAAEQVRATR